MKIIVSDLTKEEKLDLQHDPHSLGVYSEPDDLEAERQYWLDQREEEFMDVTEAEHTMEDSLEHPLR